MNQLACASRDSLSTLSPSLALWRCSSRAASSSARASASEPAHVACEAPAQFQVFRFMKQGLELCVRIRLRARPHGLRDTGSISGAQYSKGSSSARASASAPAHVACEALP